MGQKPTSPLIKLKSIVEETSEFTGREFFDHLVMHLSETLNVDGVWVTEYLPIKNELNAISFYFDHEMTNDYVYSVPDTPCEQVIMNKTLCHIPDRAMELFPKGKILHNLSAVSYMGIPLLDVNNSVMGHLGLLDRVPMPEIPDSVAIFKIFSSRATAEMRRLRSEQLLINSENKLKRLLNGAQEVIIEFDDHYTIHQVNKAAENLFKVPAEELIRKNVLTLFDQIGQNKLKKTSETLSVNSPLYSSWIQGYLRCLDSTGELIPTEASISTYSNNGQNFYSLFLYNAKDKLQAQNQLTRVSIEARMLREKLGNHNLPGLIAECTKMKNVVSLIQQVATTGLTVIITGETGTGKELVAQAIHNKSNRSDKTMITVNCAALPVDLIESELFGHVKGAFTGALSDREGRFQLADQGTLFLDEIGELPLPVQAKLLRVLQEGEFQSLGSSITKKVDVRIIAATHRNLREEVNKGSFREDLFYRLNVFPIELPPLRERGGDVLLIARRFMELVSRRHGIELPILDEANQKLLRSYRWPGNVRELQNVIERAVILSQHGNFNLTSMLSEAPASSGMVVIEEDPHVVLTESQMKDLERRNIEHALARCGWKIAGKDGAAALLNVPVTTLNSRIQKYGIKKSSNTTP